MKQATYTLEFLTPCFCAGADQARAEIRAPAIRGQLRWWFRALGGSIAEESLVFGGVAGRAQASSLIVRALEIIPGQPWQPPAKLDLDSDSYVYHFASVSGTTEKGAKGPRWSSGGAIGPRSSFKFVVLQRRPLSEKLQEKVDLTLNCFLQLGAIGLRATRGLGAFACLEVPFNPAIVDKIGVKHFACEYRPTPPLGDSAAIAREIGALVKGSRKQNIMKFDRPSPFGTSAPRQTSAVYFRPVRPSPGTKECALVVFEAPHDRILGEATTPQAIVVGHTPSRIVKLPSRAGRTSRY